MDRIDKELLTRIQRGFPICSEPYKRIGEELGISEDAVIDRIEQLKTAGVIRRIGAHFDCRQLGHVSTLCALKVPPERVAEVSTFINQFIGVTHNYLRDHEYNMWFTLIAPSQAEIARILRQIEEKLKIGPILNLPSTDVFKIRVHFRLTEEGSHAK